MKMPHIARTVKLKLARRESVIFKFLFFPKNNFKWIKLMLISLNANRFYQDLDFRPACNISFKTLEKLINF